MRLVDATTDLSCGNQEGLDHRGVVRTSAGSATIKGCGRNTIDNQFGSDYLQNQTDPHLFNGIIARRGNFKRCVSGQVAERHLFRPRVSERNRGRQPRVHGQRGVQVVQQGEGRHRLSSTPSAARTSLTNQSLQNLSDFASLSINGNPFVSGDLFWLDHRGTDR